MLILDIETANDPDKIEIIKGINPDIKILVYIQAGILPPEPVDGGYPTQLHFRPSLIDYIEGQSGTGIRNLMLKYGGNQEVPQELRGQYFHLWSDYYTPNTNTEWIDHLAEYMSDFMDDYSSLFDGIFYDSTSESLDWHDHIAAGWVDIDGDAYCDLIEVRCGGAAMALNPSQHPDTFRINFQPSGAAIPNQYAPASGGEYSGAIGYGWRL